MRPLPDFVTRPAIDWLVDGARKKTLGSAPDDLDLAPSPAKWTTRPIAEFTDRANEQHYEVPAAFFDPGAGAAPEILILPLSQGDRDPRRKPR